MSALLVVCEWWGAAHSSHVCICSNWYLRSCREKCLLTTSELDTAIQNVRIGVSSSASLSQPLLSSPFPLHSAFQTYTVMVASVVVVSFSFTRCENWIIGFEVGFLQASTSTSSSFSLGVFVTLVKSVLLDSLQLILTLLHFHRT